MKEYIVEATPNTAKKTTHRYGMFKNTKDAILWADKNINDCEIKVTPIIIHSPYEKLPKPTKNIFVLKNGKRLLPHG